MKPHLSAEELGFLLGRLPLQAMPGAVWRDPEALEPLPSRPAAPALRQPAWTSAAVGRFDPARRKG